MFAALALERDPLSYANVPSWVLSFLQTGGGFAAFGLAVWAAVYLIGRWTAPAGKARGLVFDPFGGFVKLDAPGGAPSAGWLDRALARLAPTFRRVFTACVLLAALIYLVLGAIKLSDYRNWDNPIPAPGALQQLFEYGLAVAGAFALAAILLPFVVDMLRVRPRRTWALAKLTVLEIIRRRVLWVFLLLALVFLFGTWFIDSKPENQVRSYVEVVYLAMAVLLLLPAGLLASFSIPTDIRNATIHTIATKPVERYEIFLGRLLGYSLVMTVVLVVMTSFSLLYVFRSVDPDAAAESERARVPIYGTNLRFENTPSAEKGENVGTEWEYRGYIGGRMGAVNTPPQYAIWSLTNLPSGLAQRPEPVPCEFTFAIYRTTIGELNKGVFCSFSVESWLWDPALRREFEAERARLHDEQKRAAKPLSDLEIADKLAEKYGIYELPSKEVTNFHTQRFDIPVGLFRNYSKPREEVRKDLDDLRARQQQGQPLSPDELRRMTVLEKDTRGEPRMMQVRVRCISRTQFVGMARYDLYLLDHEGSFWANFFKGAAGIWMWTELIVTVALAASTYLSGVVTWIGVGFLFLVGLFREFAVNIATGKNEGGGPAESLYRLFNRQVAVLPLQHDTVTQAALGSDWGYEWVLRRFIDILPDVDRFDFTNLVANGFNVSGTTLTVTLLFLFGYLLLWLVLGYYLIKTREIAIPT